MEQDIQENINEEGTVYICVLCGKGQSSLGDLEKHMLSHTEGPKSLENTGCLTYNIQPNNNDVAKNLCTGTNLQTENYNKENIDVCGGNSRKIAVKKVRNKILKETHENNRNLGSYLSAGKSMTEENLKEKHVSIHYCTVCHKGFTDKRNLMYHYRTHQEEKQYKCEFCGKGFHFNFNLKKHIRIHTGETPYSCDICQRGFRHKNSLNRHMMLHLDNNHNNNKKYQCIICKQYFDDQKTLEEHLVSQHQIEGHSLIKSSSYDDIKTKIKTKTYTNGGNCSLLMGTGTFQVPQVKQEPCIKENFGQPSTKNETGSISSFVCGVCMKVFNKRRGLSMHVYRRYKNIESAFCKLCDKEIIGGVAVHLMNHPFKTEDALKFVPIEQNSSLPNYDKNYSMNLNTNMSVCNVSSSLKQLCGASCQDIQVSPKHKDGESRLSTNFTKQKLHENQKNQYNKQSRSVDTILKEKRLHSTSENIPLKQTLKTVKREFDTGDTYSMPVEDVELEGKYLPQEIKDSFHDGSFNEENTSKCNLHQRDVTMPAVEYKILNSATDTCDSVQVSMDIKGHFLGSQTLQDNLKIEDSLNNDDIRSSIDAIGSNIPDRAKIFTCPVCDRAFRFKSYLKSHMKVHSGEKPHICPVCNKSFTHKFNLTKHMRTHTGETPYMCKFCGRQFSQKNSLNRHMLLHTENSLYTCYLCGLKLCDKTTFEYHLLSHDRSENSGYQNCGNKSIIEKSEILESGNSGFSTKCQSMVQTDSVVKNNNNKMMEDTVCDKVLLLNEYKGLQITTGSKIVKSSVECTIFQSDKRVQQNTTNIIVKSPIEYPISAFDKQSFCQKSFTLNHDKIISHPKSQRNLEISRSVITKDGELQDVFISAERGEMNKSVKLNKIKSSNYYGQDFEMVSGQSEPLNLSLKRGTRMNQESRVPVDSEIMNSVRRMNNKIISNQEILPKRIIKDVQEMDFVDKVLRRIENTMHENFTKELLIRPCNLQRNVFGRSIRSNSNSYITRQPLACKESCSSSQTYQHFRSKKKVRKLLSPGQQQLRKRRIGYKCKLQSTQTKRVVLKCKHCFGSFNNEISLKYHNFDHLKEENFKCDHCKKTFRLLISLNIHTIAHHST